MIRVLVLVLLATLAGCAPQMQQSGPALGPAMLDGEFFVTSDGAKLPLRTWKPVDPPRAVILALHGFNDYAQAWDQPGLFWAAHGVATFAPDLRGFGAAPGRGIWGGTELMARDVREILIELRARYPATPLFLVGESMGGALAVAVVADWAQAGLVQGVVLAAPALWTRDSMPWLYRGALWLAAHAMPWNLATGQGLRIQASDNIEVLRGLGRDPLVIKGTRADAIWGLADLMDSAMAAVPQIDRPLLVLYGARDQVVRRQPIQRLLDALTEPYRFVLYPEGWHLLFRDLRAFLVWQDVLAWIADQDQPLPSGYEVMVRPVILGASAD